jgi:NTP pyrophosphatase (non-canonical NTP hydrolase)
MTDIPYQGQIVRRYGEAQYNIAMEECAELIQAINKQIRYHTKESREDLIEEMADVLICIEQLKLLAEIKPFELQHMVDWKWERTKRELLKGDKES